jgi:acetyltransferase-like isoleucine patch superfamily enzyme
MYPRHLQVSGPKITVGDHVHFMALPDKPVRLAVFEGLGEIHIGDYSIVNPGVRISSAASVKVGHSCMFAMNCYLSDADWHDIHHRIFAPGASAPIVLKDNVWIGDSALITKGVTVGENSIVGAWSVVTKDVPDNVVVAGNPARVVRELDTSHLTLRKHLFTGDVPYDDFEDNYFRELLEQNTFARWLRSLISPTERD